MSRPDELRAGLAARKHAFDRSAPVELLASILAMAPDAGPLERQLLRYIVQVYRTTEETLREAIEHAKPMRAEELMNTVAEEWIERGKAEGKVEGKAEGRAEGKAEGKVEGKAEGLKEGETEGKAAMLLLMLERRFGTVPDAAKDRIRQAGDAQRDNWAEAAFDAATLDDVLGV